MTNFTPFDPVIPTSRQFSTRDEIIGHMIGRMVRGIFNDGKVNSVDRAIVQGEVEGFSRGHFENKTLHQLRLIEAIPSLTVTPSLLRDCGCVTHEAKNQTSVIYFKNIVGNKDSLDRMMEPGGGLSKIRQEAEILSSRSREVQPPPRSPFRPSESRSSTPDILPHRTVHQRCPTPTKRGECFAVRSIRW